MISPHKKNNCYIPAVPSTASGINQYLWQGGADPFCQISPTSSTPYGWITGPGGPISARNERIGKSTMKKHINFLKTKKFSQSYGRMNFVKKNKKIKKSKDFPKNPSKMMKKCSDWIRSTIPQLGDRNLRRLIFCVNLFVY